MRSDCPAIPKIYNEKIKFVFIGYKHMQQCLHYLCVPLSEFILHQGLYDGIWCLVVQCNSSY